MTHSYTTTQRRMVARRAEGWLWLEAGESSAEAPLGLYGEGSRVCRRDVARWGISREHAHRRHSLQQVVESAMANLACPNQEIAKVAVAPGHNRSARPISFQQLRSPNGTTNPQSMTNMMSQTLPSNHPLLNQTRHLPHTAHLSPLSSPPLRYTAAVPCPIYLTPNRSCTAHSPLLRQAGAHVRAHSHRSTPHGAPQPPAAMRPCPRHSSCSGASPMGDCASPAIR